MKNLLACLAVFAAITAEAQSTMPYNPDANDDGYIGGVDLLGLLPLYGQQFGVAGYASTKRNRLQAESSPFSPISKD